MGFYENFEMEVVNPDNFYPWPSSRDLDWAEIVSRHVILTSFQLQKLGCSQKVIGRLVKKGVLHRYKVTTPEGSLPSLFTVGKTAGIIAKLPRVRFPNQKVVRSLLLANQIIVSILSQTKALVDVNPRRPVQIVVVNNPVGIIVADSLNYPKLPLKYGLQQAIVICRKDLTVPDLPFRYVLEDKVTHDSFDIQYYARNKHALIPVTINFARNHDEDAKHKTKGGEKGEFFPANSGGIKGKTAQDTEDYLPAHNTPPE